MLMEGTTYVSWVEGRYLPYGSGDGIHPNLARQQKGANRTECQS